MSSNDELSRSILDNNKQVEVEQILNTEREKLKSKVDVFYANPEEIIEGRDQQVVCKDCTKKFFSLFFRDNSTLNISELQESEDMFDRTVANSNVLMEWNPYEKAWQCPNCKQFEFPRDPIQIKHKKKQLVAAGISNYPELFPYMKNKDMLAQGEIIVANSKTKNVSKHDRNDIFFKTEKEELLQDETMFTQPKHTKRIEETESLDDKL